ncbi:hypothetical protein CC2G_008938 [Coprinopsis cinerea AmutBmut pab1-1]|nr:hypothetical protein CC2G_008938 [Coprinopsis cinerea AmutBmut pab1-1]
MGQAEELITATSPQEVVPPFFRPLAQVQLTSPEDPLVIPGTVPMHLGLHS